MIPQVQLIPGAISAILASVTDTGTLTLSDRYGLLAATLDENLDECESPFCKPPTTLCPPRTGESRQRPAGCLEEPMTCQDSR